MMGVICLDARLSGRDVMPGYVRSPHRPTIRDFTSTALCIPNDGAPALARGDVLQRLSPKTRVRCDIMAENVKRTQPEATRRSDNRQAAAHRSADRSNLSICHCERSAAITDSNVNVAAEFDALLR